MTKKPIKQLVAEQAANGSYVAPKVSLIGESYFDDFQIGAQNNQISEEVRRSSTVKGD